MLYHSRTMGQHFEDRLKVHQIEFEARQHQNAYFEKLTLLNGATVSLVITAALGKFSETLKHKYTLGFALTFLVVAMFAFLFRNHQAARREFYEVRATANPMAQLSEGAKRAEARRENLIYLSQRAGILLTVLGVLLLLVEVWFVLWK